MAKKDYSAMSKSIIELVGTKDNIINVRHCATRLRFDLKDFDLIKEDELKSVEGVAGIRRTGNEYQVIIGPDVSKLYDYVTKDANVAAQAAVDENLDGEKKPFNLKDFGTYLMNYVLKTVTVMVPLFIGSAMCKTIALILGPDLLNVISADSDLYFVLNDLLYNATFYFMPVYIGYMAAKNLKYNPAFGIYIACLSIAPSFVALVGARESISVFGLTAPVASYAQAVFPVLFGGFVAKYVDDLIKKFVPGMMLAVLEPFFFMLIMAPIMLVVCCPFGTYIGNILSSIFMFFESSNVVIRVIGNTLLCALMPYLTFCGMHTVVITLACVTFAERGYEVFVLGSSYAYNIAVFGIALGAVIKIKNKQSKSVALTSFLTGILAGISEPTLYSIVFKYKKALLGTALACAIGGLYVGIFSPHVTGLPMATIFTIYGVWAGGGVSNLTVGMIGAGITFVAGVLCSLFFIDYNHEETE